MHNNLEQINDCIKNTLSYYDDRGDIELLVAFIYYGQMYEGIVINEITSHYPKEIKLEAVKAALADENTRQLYREWPKRLDYLNKVGDGEKRKVSILKTSLKQSEIVIFADALLGIGGGDENSWTSISHFEVGKDGIEKGVGILFTYYNDQIYAFRYRRERARTSQINPILDKKIEQFIGICHSPYSKDI